MKRIEDIKKFKDIDTYYEISNIVAEIFQDRVEAHKHLVTANKEIERLKQDNEYLNKVNIELSSRNSKATEYIKKNCDITKSYYPYVDTRYIDTKTLLDILKGSDK